jgi:hypothetical protein
MFSTQKINTTITTTKHGFSNGSNWLTGFFILMDMSIFDVLPSSWIDSNVSLKWKQQKSQELGHVP